jgi:hypothetical protein
VQVCLMRVPRHTAQNTVVLPCCTHLLMFVNCFPAGAAAAGLAATGRGAAAAGDAPFGPAAACGRAGSTTDAEQDGAGE